MVGRGKDALIPPNLSWQAHAWLRCRHPAGLGAKLFVSAFPSTHPHTLTLAVHALSSPRSHARRVELRLACNGDQRVCSPSGTEAVWRTKQAQPFSPLASVSARTQALALGAPAERHGLLVASTEIGPGQDPVIFSSRSVLCMLAAGEIAPTQCIVEWALRPRALWQLLPRCSPDASPTSLAHTAPALARRPFACRASPFPHRRTRPLETARCVSTCGIQEGSLLRPFPAAEPSVRFMHAPGFSCTVERARLPARSRKHPASAACCSSCSELFATRSY
jgi:hypothetical protein